MISPNYHGEGGTDPRAELVNSLRNELGQLEQRQARGFANNGEYYLALSRQTEIQERLVGLGAIKQPNFPSVSITEPWPSLS